MTDYDAIVAVLIAEAERRKEPTQPVESTTTVEAAS